MNFQTEALICDNPGEPGIRQRVGSADPRSQFDLWIGFRNNGISRLVRNTEFLVAS